MSTISASHILVEHAHEADDLLKKLEEGGKLRHVSAEVF
jgi:hypothetical protein